MMPSEWAGIAPVAARSSIAQRRPDHPPVGADLEPVEDAAEQPELRVGLGAVQAARDVRQRRAGGDERRRHGERARRRVGVRERRGVHHDACHEQRPRARRRRRRAGRRGGPRAASPSRRSRRRRARSSPRRRRRVRGVVVDDDAAAASRTAPRAARPDRPDPRRRAAVARRRAGRRPPRDRGRSGHRSTPARKAYSGGAGSADGRRPCRRTPRGCGTRRARRRACRRPGSRGSTARTWCAARSRARTARDGVAREAARSSASLIAAVPRLRAPRAAGAPGRPARSGPRGRPVGVAALAPAPAAFRARRRPAPRARRRRPRGGSRGPASAATRRTASIASGSLPSSSSWSSWRTRVPALHRVVEPDVELGDAPDPQPPAELVADEPHRVLERAERLLPVGPAADHAHPDLRVAEVRRRLDVGDRHEPDPRVGDLLREERADLLAQELVDAIGSLASSSSGTLRRRHAPLGGRAHAAARPGGPQPATRLRVCVVKHSMMSPSARSL